MKVYSNSRLWIYENCPEYFKVKYIDKTLPDIPKSINLFLGSLVHDSLEWLYNSTNGKNHISMDELIFYFAKSWKENFDSGLKVENGEKSEDYFNKGIKCLVDYYQKNKPFLDNTIATEKKIFFPLGEGYFIQGFIDRLVFNEKREFEVHDYKTNNSLKSQEEIDKDRQLAFYQMGLNKIFGNNIKVKLIWHFLAHNKKIDSERTQNQLEKLREDTLKLIKKIENTEEWRACGRPWCEWCEWKRAHGINNHPLK